MVKLLVTQLSRFGDLLQTSAMVRTLRRKYPHAEITLLCRYNLLEVYRNSPDVDRLEAFNIEEYAKKLRGKDGLYSAYLELKNAVRGLQAENFDLVVNATHDRFSTFLTALLYPKRVKGMSLHAGKRLEITVNQFWFRYLRCTPEFRRSACFNLVDIYKNSVGGDPYVRNLFFEVSKRAQGLAEKLLADGMAGDPGKGITYIGFQVGTSTGFRRWPTGYFAELGDRLQSDPKVRVVLFGSVGEKRLGERLSSQMTRRPVDLIGKTNLSVLAALLSRCRVLVTNDTGTMHLAGAVGTQCISLFFESANAFQTGVYGEGHIICTPALDCFPCPTNISCYEKRCLDAIPADLVHQLVSWKALGGRKENIMIPQGTNVYETGFDGDGLWELSPLGGQKLNVEDLIRLVYRQVWVECSMERENGVTRKDRSVHGSESIRLSNVASRYEVDGTELENWLHEFVMSIETLAEKVNRGKVLLGELQRDASYGTSDGEALLEKSTQLEILNEKIVQLGSSPYLTQVASLFNLELGQAKDGHFLLVCREWEETYKNLGFRIGLLREQLACWHYGVRDHCQSGIGGEFKYCPKPIETST